MITADTITDEQIRELFTTLAPGHVDVSATLDAVNAPMGSLRRIMARGRCAEILNARATK